MNNQVLTRSAIVSTILQVVMVLVNHYAPALAGPMLAPIGGTGIGLVAGVLYGLWAKGGTLGQNAAGGAAAGVVGGVLGSLLSMGLGDVPAATVGVAGVSTAVSGAIGGAIGRMFGQKS